MPREPDHLSATTSGDADQHNPTNTRRFISNAAAPFRERQDIVASKTVASAVRALSLHYRFDSAPALALVP